MSSQLFLRNITSELGTALRFMFPGRGASVVTNTVTLVTGPATIAWTITAGGTVAEWVSPRVPAGGFTLAGSITFNGWFRELATNDNCGVKARIWRRDTGGGETEILPTVSTAFTFGGATPTEFTTTLAATNWSGTPNSTAFAEDERLIVRFYAIDANGTMTAGSAEHTTNGATAAASGDSYITLTETVDWKTETITKTLKTSGGHYSLLSSWEAAQQSDLVTDDVIAQLECYAGDYNDAVTIFGWTTGAANYVRIFTPTAERHDGRERAVSGVGMRMTGTTAAVFFSEDYIRIEGLEINRTSATSFASAAAPNAILTSGANDLRIDDCILSAATTSGGVVRSNIAGSLANLTIRNTIVINTGTSTEGISSGNMTSMLIEHCTLLNRGSTTHGAVGGPEMTIRNTYAGGYTTEDFSTAGTDPTGNNNASSDTTATTLFTSSLASKAVADQFVNTTGGSENYHLKSGSALEGAGVALGAVPLDIDGQTRDGTTPDIGADEFVQTSTTWTYSGTGGAASTGVAALNRAWAPVVSGGAASGGTAATNRAWAPAAAGGATISGTVETATTHAIIGQGGAVAVGAASVARTIVLEASGGASCGGAATTQKQDALVFTSGNRRKTWAVAARGSRYEVTRVRA